jgi:hypothetical protein
MADVRVRSFPGTLASFRGFHFMPLFSNLLWTVIGLDTESDPSLYAFSSVYAPVWPLCYLVQHVLVKTWF